LLFTYFPKKYLELIQIALFLPHEFANKQFLVVASFVEQIADELM